MKTEKTGQTGLTTIFKFKTQKRPNALVPKSQASITKQAQKSIRPKVALIVQ